MEKSTGQPRVAGIVLAAGSSSRYGDPNKLLETVDGQPLIRRSVLPYVHSKLDSVLVVVGHDADNVVAAVDDLPVTIVVNPDYDRGQSTSVRQGIEELERIDPDAVLIGLGDMPGIHPDVLNRIVEAYATDSDRNIIVPYHEGNRGNPVLFDREYFGELQSVQGDKGGRELLLEESVFRLDVRDPSILRDVDRPEDLDDFET